ncbi:MAG: spondin domain-containing protein [Chiayiivirga sp.]|jgi:hypothetical protein|uniref:spondin domain-containing protein n=1 Tax=Chiayiivirga sp. TaxID=2041042 RepID=UPI0025BE568A|nr:spondin domain-containing protein [Chiayiivirga sp.]MCI1710248.1 spondin domain-containing protein [Chiayiivirga sp.]MCI1728958.1 spondin domain-containing protein [Chiayiivirga sp.]
MWRRYVLLAVLAGGSGALTPLTSIAAEPVPTIFEAENTQGVQGDHSVIVFAATYFLHDGSFDAFDVGAKASQGVAALAQGLGVIRFRDEFLASHPTGFVSYVERGLCFQNPDLLQFDAREQNLDPVKHRYLSYLARVFPADDAFVGNDNPMAHEVFDENGVFQGPIVIELTGADVLDAGTRLNDETDIGGFDQLGGTDIGIATDDVILEHPGFNGSMRNPNGSPQRVLGGTARYHSGTDCATRHRVDPILGDFTRPGFRLNRFRLSSRLSSYFSGAWYDPARSGEGFQIEIFDAAAPKLSLTWFTYEPDGSGRQKWLTGVGTIDYLSAEVELYETEGGIMGSIENPQRVQRKRWGTATAGFANCWSGAVIHNPDDPAAARGAIYVQRLTAVPAGLERDCGAYTLQADAAPEPWP